MPATSTWSNRHSADYAPPVVNGEGAPGDAAVVADLARRASEGGSIPAAQVDDGLVVRVRRADEVIDAIDLEKYLSMPRQARGNAYHVDPTSFAEYVKRNLDDTTTVWADANANSVTAVFNDHLGADGGWRDHRAVLKAELDDEWTAWADRSGKLGGQESFAEFIEEHYPVIDGEGRDGAPAGPSAAEMLEIASTFQARRTSSFERGTRLQSGDVQLKWQEETTAKAGTKGTMEVPERFYVRLAPYRGVDPVIVTCLLRYRVRDGQLAIGFQMHRRDDILRRAFTSLVEVVSTGLEGKAPLYRGMAPTALR